MARPIVDRSVNTRQVNQQRHAVSSRELSYLPRWRGFALRDLEDVGKQAYNESDFQMIAYYGFNFVRLALNYEYITLYPTDETTLDPVALGYIDQAISWGIKYGIHIMLDMHEVPGYSVLVPKQTPWLWTDATCQATFTGYWTTLAARYKGIPNTQLSFNLLNEPLGISHGTYKNFIIPVIDAIKAVDPTRLMFADGILSALVPCQELIGTGVGQTYHGLYTPMSVSHYGAVWIAGFQQYPIPAWPTTLFPSNIYGNDYPDYKIPIRVSGNFSTADTISLNISQCNIRAQYQIWDATNNILLVDTGLLTMGASGPGTPYLDPVWNVWSNKDLGIVATGALTQPSSLLEIRVPDGNWSIIQNIQVYTQGHTTTITPNTIEQSGYYGLSAIILQLDANGDYSPDLNNWNIDTIRTLVKAWSDLLVKRGIDVFVGEGGVFHTVPDDVTLAYLRDHLQVLKEYNIGFTIWMWRGTWGVIDSERNMTGICNTNGTTATFVSGTATGTVRTSFFYWPPGTIITINGIDYQISSVASNVATLTLATSAGVQNGVPFAYGSTNYETVTFPDGSTHYLDVEMMELLQAY